MARLHLANRMTFLSFPTRKFIRFAKSNRSSFKEDETFFSCCVKIVKLKLVFSEHCSGTCTGNSTEVLENPQGLWRHGRRFEAADVVGEGKGDEQDYKPNGELCWWVFLPFCSSNTASCQSFSFHSCLQQFSTFQIWRWIMDDSPHGETITWVSPAAPCWLPCWEAVSLFWGEKTLGSLGRKACYHSPVCWFRCLTKIHIKIINHKIHIKIITLQFVISNIYWIGAKWQVLGTSRGWLSTSYKIKQKNWNVFKEWVSYRIDAKIGVPAIE